MLGAHRQRLAVDLAVMEQIPLIGLEDRLGRRAWADGAGAGAGV